MKHFLTLMFCVLVGCATPRATESYTIKPQSEIEQLLSPERSRMFRDWAFALGYFPVPNEEYVPSVQVESPPQPISGGWIILWD